MNESFGQTAAIARTTSGLSQEAASQLLHVSTRTLSNYENNITKVPDEIVYQMMNIYHSQSLGWNYLINTSKVAKTLISGIRFSCGISSGALGLEVSTNEFLSIRNDFNRICLDDVITLDEQSTYDKCRKTIQMLIGTGISALIAIKKEPQTRERLMARVKIL
ncbi:helix-turn-helix domain-containing protein [Pectinatus frisingensis]|uniref:helix-turn-helix domain-containing protein n=1 Tax=Pectinatus frisingensis TaxID=865 RepID=UPI003D80214C